MPAKKAASKKKRVAVKDLPAAKKKVSSKDMKKVKGGFIVCRGSEKSIVLCKNQASIILCKSGQG